MCIPTNLAGFVSTYGILLRRDLNGIRGNVSMRQKVTVRRFEKTIFSGFTLHLMDAFAIYDNTNVRGKK